MRLGAWLAAQELATRRGFLTASRRLGRGPCAPGAAGGEVPGRSSGALRCAEAGFQCGRRILASRNFRSREMSPVSAVAGGPVLELASRFLRQKAPDFGVQAVNFKCARRSGCGCGEARFRNWNSGFCGSETPCCAGSGGSVKFFAGSKAVRARAVCVGSHGKRNARFPVTEFQVGDLGGPWCAEDFPHRELGAPSSLALSEIGVSIRAERSLAD